MAQNFNYNIFTFSNRNNVSAYCYSRILYSKRCKVPDVSGMKYTTAVNTLVEKGFEVTEPNIVYTDDVETGDVIKQTLWQEES